MDLGFLERCVGAAQFPVYQAINRQKKALTNLSFGFWSHADIYALVLDIATEISTNSLRRETGNVQGNIRQETGKTTGKIFYA